MKKVVHFEVHFVILYSKTELLTKKARFFFYIKHQKEKPKKDKISCSTCGAVAPRSKPNLFLCKDIYI